MILILSIIILPIIFLYLLKKKNTVKIPVPPGPPGLPLIGNLYQFGTASNQHIYLWDLSKKYGPIMQLKIGSVPLLVVSSPESAREVLKTQDLAFCGRPSLVGQRKLSYNCIGMVFSPYGEYWRELRKLATMHLLSLKKVESFRNVREDVMRRMVGKISRLASSQTVVDLSAAAMALSSSLICRIAFGKRYGERGSEMRRFDGLLHEAQALLATFFVSDYFPAFGWVDKLTGLMNRLDKTFENLDSFYDELIWERLDPKRAKATEEEDDILDVLIRLKEQKLCSIDLEWVHIKALLTDIFIAATDTTAASIVWTMTALMKSPHVMQKVQTEIRSLTGKRDKVDEDDLEKLPYLKAVIHETLRLYPPAPLLVPRETTEKCSISGYEIQPKTVVFVNAWAIARDSEYWENPDEFSPERFLKSNIDVRGQDYGVIPFGSGRRICPGMLMGLANVELGVANLLNSFDWELPPGIVANDVDTDALPGITMHKKNALLVVAKNCSII